MRRAPLLLAAALAALPAAAAAQSLNAEDAADAAAVGAELATGFAKSQLVVQADAGDSDASLVVSRARDFDDGKRIGFTAWSLKATVPIDKGTKSGSFVTDLRLAHVNSLELSWNRVRTHATADARDPDVILAAASKECHAHPERKLGTKPDDCDKLNARFLRPWMTANEKRTMFPDEVGEWTTALTLSASVGAKSFDYRDPTSLDEASKDRTVYALSFQFGGARESKPDADFLDGWYTGLGGAYGRTYEEAKTQTLCKAPPPTGPQECFTAPFGPPEEKTAATVFGILRKTGFVTAWNLPWGLQLKPAYDFESKVTGLEATLYLLPSTKGALTGGLRGKLQTRDDDPTTDDDTASLAIFVGAPF